MNFRRAASGLAGLLVAMAVARAAVPPVPVVVQLDWVVNAQFAGLVVAQERGLYAAAGLAVELKPIDQAEMDAVAPVVRAAGKTWIGCADGTFLLKARLAGAPVKAFATMLQASPIGLMTLESAGIDRLSALAGKKIGLHAYNRPQLAIMLASDGLKPADVEVIEVGDEVDSLATGRIAAQVCYLIDEPVALERRGFKLKTFPGYQHGYAGYAQVYFTTETTLARDPAVLQKFLRASNEGWRLALAEPEKTAALIVQKYLPGGDVAYQAESLRKMSGPLVAETGWSGIGQMRRATWEQSARLSAVASGAALTALLDGCLDFSVLRAFYPAWTP